MYSLFSYMSTHVSFVPSQRSSIESYIPPLDTLIFAYDQCRRNWIKIWGIRWCGYSLVWCKILLEPFIEHLRHDCHCCRWTTRSLRDMHYSYLILRLKNFFKKMLNFNITCLAKSLNPLLTVL